MPEGDTPWPKVPIGATVRGARDGAAWKVNSRHGDEVTISCGERKFTFVPFGSVEVLSFPEEGQASRVVAATAPGSGVQAVKAGPNSGYRCPEDFPEAGSFLAHLHVMHGRPARELPVELEGLRNFHAILHGEGQSGGTAHAHVRGWRSDPNS